MIRTQSTLMWQCRGLSDLFYQQKIDRIKKRGELFVCHKVFVRIWNHRVWNLNQVSNLQIQEIQQTKVYSKIRDKGSVKAFSRTENLLMRSRLHEKNKQLFELHIFCWENYFLIHYNGKKQSRLIWWVILLFWHF